MARLLLKASVFSFLGLFIVFELLLLLAGQGLKLWYVPIVLSLVMVVVTAAMLVPIIGGFCWLLAALTRYSLALEGVRQGAAGVLGRVGHREVSWLEFRRYEVQTLAGVTVVKMIAGELDPPITIYHSLLENPQAFWHTWIKWLPETSVMHADTQALVENLLAREVIDHRPVPQASATQVNSTFTLPNS
jgi:hypothetical protein